MTATRSTTDCPSHQYPTLTSGLYLELLLTSSGKTRSAIATASAYLSEWPVLVVCPSSARHHWQAEIVSLLGQDYVLPKEVLLIETSAQCAGKLTAGTAHINI